MRIGNLFELAETQLHKEQGEGKIPCYTMLDIIDYAVKIRKWLDRNQHKLKKVTKLTKEEIRKKNNQYRMKNYYAKLEGRLKWVC